LQGIYKAVKYFSQEPGWPTWAYILIGLGTFVLIFAPIIAYLKQVRKCVI